MPRPFQGGDHQMPGCRGINGNITNLACQLYGPNVRPKLNSTRVWMLLVLRGVVFHGSGRPYSIKRTASRNVGALTHLFITSTKLIIYCLLSGLPE